MMTQEAITYRNRVAKLRGLLEHKLEFITNLETRCELEVILYELKDLQEAANKAYDDGLLTMAPR
jgi:hypothetical protein